MIFDGRRFAGKMAADLKQRVRLLKRRPKLVTIYNPQHGPSQKYTELKAKKATEIGVDFLQIPIHKPQVSIKSRVSSLKSQIKVWNEDNTVNGIMVQIPLGFGVWDLEIVREILPDKDVDGLREDSPFKPAVVRAVREILNSNIEILNKSKIQNSKIVIVGANGFVGRKLCNELRTMNYELGGLDIGDNLNQLKNVDIVISATGQAGLIKPEMVKNGFMAIDVGYPQPEFTPEALAKASFYTPVPGGVGPVTVVMLFANLLESCK